MGAEARTSQDFNKDPTIKEMFQALRPAPEPGAGLPAPVQMQSKPSPKQEDGVPMVTAPRLREAAFRGMS